MAKLEKKNFSDNILFKGFETSPNFFQEQISNYEHNSSSSMYEEQLFKTLNSIEETFKIELALILDLLVRLTKNVPCASLVSDGEIRECHQKREEKKNGKLLGRYSLILFQLQLPASFFKQWQQL